MTFVEKDLRMMQNDLREQTGRKIDKELLEICMYYFMSAFYEDSKHFFMDIWKRKLSTKEKKKEKQVTNILEFCKGIVN